MRMLADAARPRGRRKFGWSCVVEQQERAEVGALGVVRKEASHREAVTDPMPLGTRVYRHDSLHGRTFAVMGRFIEHEDRSAIPQGAMLAAT
jgi:hypothetical protein